MRKVLLQGIVAFTLCAVGGYPVGFAYASTNLTERFTKLETDFGLPQGILGRIAKAETGTCNATLKARNSSATGLFQWLDSSWRNTAPRVNPQYASLALRTDPFVSAHVTAYSLANTKARLGSLISQARIDMAHGLYLGHFLGDGGARQFLTAYARDPNANAAQLFPRAAAANQPVFRGGTLRSVVQYLANKMSSSCTSVTNYTSRLNDGPIGSDVADRAVASSPPGTVTSNTFQDPERDYPSTYSIPPANSSTSGTNPPRHQSPIQVPMMQPALIPSTPSNDLGTLKRLLEGTKVLDVTPTRGASNTPSQILKVIAESGKHLSDTSNQKVRTTVVTDPVAVEVAHVVSIQKIDTEASTTSLRNTSTFGASEREISDQAVLAQIAETMKSISEFFGSFRR